MAIERRNSVRTPVDFFCNAFLSGVPAVCVARDVSEAGIGLHVVRDRLRSRPEHIDVEFQLPGNERVIAVRGQLRGGQDYGVVFDAISSDDRAAIREFMSLA